MPIDPLSVAAGAGVAAIVKGKASKKAAKPGSVSKIIDAILLPSSDVIGKHWAKNLNEWFEGGRAKRLEFLGDHLDRAAEVGGTEKLDEIADDPSFSEWAESVSKIDPADKELSDIWQAALLSLQRGGVLRLRTLNLAKKLSPDEAATFLDAMQNSTQRLWLTTWYHTRFVELGLVKQHQPLTVYLSAATAFALSAMSAIVLPEMKADGRPGEGEWSAFFKAAQIVTPEAYFSAAALAAFAVFLLFFYLRVPRPRLRIRSPRPRSQGEWLGVLESLIVILRGQADDYSVASSEATGEAKRLYALVNRVLASPNKQQRQPDAA